MDREMMRVYDKYKKGRVLKPDFAGMGLLIITWPTRNYYYQFSARYHLLAFIVLEMGSCSLLF